MSDASVRMPDVDVAVVGGGMVGASFALALAGARVRVAVVEAVAPDSSAQPSFDERTTALGNASRRIFESLGIWDRIASQASAIHTIHVSDAGRYGFARLKAREQGVEAFGYVAANRVIGAALWERLASASGVIMKMPARLEALQIGAQGAELLIERAGTRESFSARLVVAADGARSKVRQVAGIEARIRDYGQVALVANVRADDPHDGTAYERFTHSGPMALLPLHDGSYTSVWARSRQDADDAMRFDDAEYLRQLQRAFGWRAGRFLEVGRRGSYPLELSRAAAAVGPRSVLIGNAAQTLHPVAGQGFNLGLRDAAALAEVLVEAGGDAGAPETLARFAAQREADRRGVVGFTDGLVRLFGSSSAAIGIARDAGLLIFDLLPPAKSALARVSKGFGGRAPRLARGLPLV